MMEREEALRNPQLQPNVLEGQNEVSGQREWEIKSLVTYSPTHPMGKSKMNELTVLCKSQVRL